MPTRNPKDLPPRVEADEAMMLGLTNSQATLGAGRAMLWAHSRIRYLEARLALMENIADDERKVVDAAWREKALGA